MENARQKAAWIALALNGAGILVFGLIVLALPAPDLGYYRAIGVASVGMGAFGLLITLMPFRKRERWAWWAMWFYPLFWSAHLVLGLPPGKDHVHQVVFLLLALLGLALSFKEFFPPLSAAGEGSSSSTGLIPSVPSVRARGGGVPGPGRGAEARHPADAARDDPGHRPRC